jgi:hypothetical protein
LAVTRILLDLLPLRLASSDSVALPAAAMWNQMLVTVSALVQLARPLPLMTSVAAEPALVTNALPARATTAPGPAGAAFFSRVSKLTGWPARAVLAAENARINSEILRFISISFQIIGNSKGKLR